MKVRKNIGRMTFEFEASTHKEVFSQLSGLEEVFSETNCGRCHGEELRHLVREHDGYMFYELRCLNSDCRARLAYGQAREGDRLFPKRKDDAGNWIDSDGWQRWNPDTKRAE